MKTILPTLIFLLSIVNVAQAQLETIYTNFYDDGIVDTLFESNDLIALSDGNFAVSTRFNPTGEFNYSAGVLKLDAAGKVLSSFGTEANNENANLPWLSEGSDGSIWVAFGSMDESGEENTRIIKLSADLSTVTSDQEVDLFSGREQLYGINNQGDDLFIVVSGVIPNDTSGTLETAYNLYNLNPSTLATKNEVVDVFPRVSFSARRNVKIVPVGADRIAMAIRAFDPSTGVGGDILLTREFMTSDLTQVAEYMLPGIGRDSYSMDFEYLPAPHDAYAFSNRTFSTFLIRRAESPNLVIDTIPVPAGVSGLSFRNSFVYHNNSLLALGRNAYQINFDGAEVDTVVIIENFRISGTSILNATSDGNTIMALSANNFSDVISTNFSVADAEFQDTTVLANARANIGVQSYWGGYIFPSHADSTLPLVGLRQSGNYLSEGRFDWGFRMIDAETGEGTGKTVGGTDIEFWEGGRGIELSPLVAVGDGFMAFTNEGSRKAFFRFDKDFNAIPTDSVGLGATRTDVDRFFFGNRITQSVPTSYGILGSDIQGVGTPEGTVYSPFIFASDTSLVTRIDTVFDAVSVYPFEPFILAVDSTDSFYGVAMKAEEGNQFTQTDSVAIIGFAASDSIRYVNYFTLPDADFSRVTAMLLNEAQDELLISGTVRDSNFVTSGFRAQVNPADGSLINFVVYSPTDLGYSEGDFLNEHIAVYDEAGNIVHTLRETINQDGLGKSRLRMIQVDTSEAILRNKVIYTHSSTSFFMQNVVRLGESLYVSGQSTSISGIERSAVLIRVNTGSLVNTKDPIAIEISSKVFPNPTAGNITLAWENPETSDYQLQLIDYTGKILQQWKGNEPSGPAQINLQLDNLPHGIYYFRLGLESGFAVHPFVKH